MARRPRDRVKPVFLSPMGFDRKQFLLPLPTPPPIGLGRDDPGECKR